MSRITHTLNHRANVKRLNQTNVNGTPTYNWVTIKTNWKCRLDLTFIRTGKDPTWTPEAGRQPDRNGVLFADLPDIILPGDRIEMTKGPTGTFQIDGAPDIPEDMSKPSHVEYGVKEVAQSALGTL